LTTDHFLTLDAFNVIIVGDGAIGSALLDNLLQRTALQHAIVLGRSDKGTTQDTRVTRLHFDAVEPASIARAASRTSELIGRAHLLINTVGVLHSGSQQPEKQLRSLDPLQLQQSFLINATLLPLLAQAFGKLLRHDEPAMLASLSARVGSIEDNKAGGWYSYRASKAAHNMLLKTLALEWKLSHRKATVVALHPGTVISRLSDPFISPSYKKPLLSPAESAQALLHVMSQLQPEQSGRFYDWQGQPIPW
jgi:NAD(P)-dependent dehydrogenase (short-subunit alcohol dehydrogenase family)